MIIWIPRLAFCMASFNATLRVKSLIEDHTKMLALALSSHVTITAVQGDMDWFDLLGRERGPVCFLSI